MDLPDFIFFDYGQTLINPKFDREAWIKHWIKLGKNTDHLTPDAVREVADELIETTADIREKHYMEFNRAQFDRNLADRLGVEFDLTREEMDLDYVKSANKEKVEPGARTALENVKSMNINMGVVSNSVLGHAALEYMFERNDLLKYFDFVLSSADCGFRKPHRQIFKTALSISNSDPMRSWFIGDRLDTDIAGAQSSSMIGIWYNPGGLTKNGIISPDYTLYHWDDLLNLLSDCA